MVFEFVGNKLGSIFFKVCMCYLLIVGFLWGIFFVVLLFVIILFNLYVFCFLLC